MTDAISRAEDDLRRGDYALARQRLESYLAHKRYDPDLLAKLGRICFDMHDLFNAGRHWLLSSEEGEDVDRAIAEFMRRAGQDPRQAAEQLLRTTRLPELAAYPPIVRTRLKSLSMETAIAEAYRPKKVPPRKISRGDRVLIFIVVAFFLTVLASCSLGLVTFVRWINSR